ncbi:YbhB/YbcL family Raf kinase inhibitor-like protein [Paraburkholderia bonniea]|uniref:YbhB/YbcL family Raf kinase inhibitor-like protein n=1 Tax=Paraburkholderia bonniea TaxID=2152891 RepID=UPI0012926DF7|nr:YbhB/YbcL family Raf kinase inhibitor-like protein [Paraburkholderia bonniea]WJF89395.1 YbhB/YbcL family Raf kinase inhibitor-like protein [Paraburkholderia bonniea]WJF92710.1 YbhB/YbcL family Raf kinase inhibitor-like protein [Paraburkholderia bonniea]
MTAFRLWSDAFAANGFMSKAQEFDSKAFGVDGGNCSPDLQWEAPPPGTQSFALTVYDPDAPTGSGFWHWVMVNLPADLRALPTGAGSADGSLLPPEALQLRNDYGLPGFGGAAPPRGDKPHRYIFQLHAMKVAQLPLEAQTTNAIARFMIHLNQIDSATYTGLYELK